MSGRRRSIGILRLALATLAAASSPGAFAGAFLQAPDQGIVIAGGAFSDAVRAYDAAGRLVPVAAWRKFELTSYAEYGVTDWLTAIASPSLFTFPQDPPGQSRSATAIAEAGARVKAYEWDGNVFSAQILLRAPLGGASARVFADTTRFAQADLRVGYGRGFDLFGFRAFSDLQIGARTGGLFGHEARVDATLGLWAREDLLVLLQSFSAATPASWRRVRYLQEKVAGSAVYWFTPTIGLQVGATAALRGVNSSAERGGFTALWYRF